jgi:hypothetical protein
MFGGKHWERAEGTIVDRRTKKENMDAQGTVELWGRTLLRETFE